MKAVGDLRALFYADARCVVNDVRDVVRRPARLLVWALFVVPMVSFWISRSLSRRPPTGLAGYADATAATVLLVVAAALLLKGRLTLFRHRAEARRIIGSPLSPRVAIAYCLLRSSGAQALRMLTSLLVPVLLFAGSLPPSTLALDIVLLALLVAAALVLQTLRAVVGPRAAIALATAGGLIGAYAVLVLVRTATIAFAPSLEPLASLVRLTVLAPGRLLLDPSLLPVASVLAIIALGMAAAWRSTRDVYPELYARSEAQFVLRERLAQGRVAMTAAAAARRRTAIGLAAPAGAPAIVWKSIASQWRGVPPLRLAGGAAVWVAIGALAARMPSDLRSIVLGTIVPLGLLAFSADGAAVAGELRVPLFWLGPATLAERLIAVVAAMSWRRTLTAALVSTGFAGGGGGPIGALAIAEIVPLVLLSASIGLAIFALFPAAADRRGPTFLLQLLTLFAAATIGVLAGGLAAAVTSLVVGALVGTIVVLVECGIALAVAAAVFEGRSDRLSRA